VPSIPSHIPEIGSTSQPLRPNPSFKPQASSSLTPQDYYVFSRIDGATSVRDLILMVGLGVDETIAIVCKLRELGAVLLPGESAVPTPSSLVQAAHSEAAVALTSPEVTGAWALRDRPAEKDEATPDPMFTTEERAALDEENGLADHERRRILEMRRLMGRRDHFEILGVLASASKREVKRAYFALSKEFHPDRYFGVETGSFGPLLAEIFERVNLAYSVLSSPRQRAAYEASLRGEANAQTPEEHAEELFRQGGELEARGELDEALKHFEASIRVRPSLASIRRAAACALSARRIDLAESFALRAVSARREDPSLQRLLAAVYREKGDLQGAEQILARALEVKGASDVLAKELAADLASVRAARAKSRDRA
jgi:tetratricopeptide (TPR) repeat protein